MAHLQNFVVVFLLLKLNVEVAETACSKSTTLKLLDDQVLALQTSIRTIASDNSCCETKVKVPVGFHVYTSSSKTYAKDQIWVYDKVVTNTHNAYSTSTGKFVVPEKGLYIFAYGTLSNPGKMSHAALHVNGIVKSWQACNNGNGAAYSMCSNSAVLLVEKNDVVYVADFQGTALVRDLYTSFSGAKLY